ncbi:MAG: Release factor glutamine methyltransferase [Planctomycetes bacterium]|nr:Release factor glutamine methyltransferase [Planctomycetota bacterium]
MGLRNLLRRTIRGSAASSLPPPAVRDAAHAAEVKAALAAVHAGEPDRFAEFFLAGRPTAPRGALSEARLALLGGAGLCRSLVGAWRPSVRVFPLDGAMIATDLLTHEGEDQVFSLMYEQALLVRNLGVRPGDHVLELCLGSGVQAIFATDTAARVVGVDVSPRALSFAAFNAALNPGAVPLETRLGSLYEPLAAVDRFDLIVVNPPFEPVPPGATWFLHSHGGPDGLDVVRKILDGAPARLRDGGRFTMFTWSPGGDEGAVVAEMVRDAFPRHCVRVLLADWRTLDQRIATFEDAPGFAAWRDSLRARGWTRIWGVLVTASPRGAPGIELVDAPDEILAAKGIASGWL